MRTSKILLAGLLLLWTMPALLSCRKEDLNGSHSATDSTGSFSATVAGVAWQTDSVSAFLTCAGTNQPRIMTISAYGSQRAITISMRDTARGANDSTLSVATYPTIGSGDLAEFGYAKNIVQVGRSLVWQEQGGAISGEAVVTACDGGSRKISGTFAFSAKVLLSDSTGLHIDTVSITNGVFKNISYSYFMHP